MHLNSIQVLSQPNPGLAICVSSPPRLPDSRFFFVSVESYLILGPDIYISPTSWKYLASIQVHQIASQFHPSVTSNPYRFHDVSHLHPDPFSTEELYLSFIPVPKYPILVSRWASQLNPGPISTPSRSRDLCLLSTNAPRFSFLLCLVWISHQPGSWYLHFAYIQVTCHLHPGPPNCILVPSKRHLKPIHLSRCASLLHPDPQLENCVSAPS